VSEGDASPHVTRVDAGDGWEQDEETGGLVRMLRDADSVLVGLWKPDEAAGRKIEYVLDADETLSRAERQRRSIRNRASVGGSFAWSTFRCEATRGPARLLRGGTLRGWQTCEPWRSFRGDEWRRTASSSPEPRGA
jgi:hypothetical protein